MIGSWTICMALVGSADLRSARMPVQGTIDHQLSGSIITVSECTAMVSGGVILLTLLGVNVSALLVPAALAVAYAAKDLSHNFLAGLCSCYALKTCLFIEQMAGPLNADLVFQRVRLHAYLPGALCIHSRLETRNQ